MYNHLNIPEVMKDVDINGLVCFIQEGNGHREKGTKTAKDMFINQKGNFGEVMVMKMYMKKILQHLSKDNSNKTEIKNRFKKYKIDLKDVLQSKLSSCIPILFILINDKKYIFIIKNSSAIEFKFKDLIDIQIYWFYFSISLVVNVPNPLLRIEYKNTVVKRILLPIVSK